MQLISKSVGKGGTNAESDVKVVQQLLNKFTKEGGYAKLAEDGKIGKNTLDAIGAFQTKVVGMKRADQLVEPGKGTIKKLNESPAALAKEAEKEKKEEAGAGAGAGKGKVSGKTNGVGQDILEFLDAVAKHYGITIKVNSGKRSPEEQGEAMLDNWLELKRGNVYAPSALSNSDKKTLDELYVKARESSKISPADKKQAEEEFIKLATQKVGKKSKHSSGRAVDLEARSVSKKAFDVINYTMKYVDEGGRTDIYHFESDSKIPAADDRMKSKWPTP